MVEVAALSREICIEMERPDLIAPCLAVGLLHDFSDHKYDKDGSLESELKMYLETHFDAVSAKLIMDTIDHISYSKEAAIRAILGHTTSDEWNEDLPVWRDVLGPIWSQIRNVVSDADKLLASGEDGWIRTYGYKEEAYAKTHGGATIPEDLRREQMFEIYTNRLSKTHTHLMHTAPGKSRALRKWITMSQIADRYFEGYSEYTEWRNV